MSESVKKCVIVIDGTLPFGVIANTAAILGATLGKQLPQVVGRDVVDESGRCHLGIVQLPIPVLKGTPGQIGELRRRLYEEEFADCLTVDFSDVAQSCRTYEVFEEKMRQTPEERLQYLGVAICADRKKVNKLTGSMPLLR